MKRINRALLCVALALAAVPATAKSPRHPARKGRAARAARPRVLRIDPNMVNNPATASNIGPGSAGGAVLRAQVLLARAHFSPGEMDARYGSTLKKVIAAFQKSRSLPETGEVDAATWTALNADAAPALIEAPIAPEDVAGPFQPIPEDMAEKAKLPAMNFTSPLEGLAEKYHSSPDLLKRLNPGAAFDQAGQMLWVPNVATPPPGKVARVVVSKEERSVATYDEQGRPVSWYPATIGSEHDPLPLGKWKILGVSRNPRFRYNPALFWDARPGEGKEWIPAGPNNPVGVAWIDLSKPHYGIHGSPEPSRIGKTESHGCIRLTNWDVWELQQMVSPGTPALLEP
ncbi:MAG: L,D-transpeptidase [Acidobacteriota bacterium]